MRIGFKHIVCVLMTSLCSIVGYAYDFGVDGIYYNRIAGTENEVEVTNGLFKYSGAFVIPESISFSNISYKVTSIGSRAFENCTGLISIEIPNSVEKSIGNYTFYGCTNLVSVSINSTSIVSNDYSANHNFLTIFGSQVQEYVIGEGVKTIGDKAFLQCSRVTSITLPNSLTSIGNYSFYQCTSLKSIVIPNGVTSIGDCAFCSCTGLTSITIPNSVTSIGENAFSGCAGLTSIEIPNSVTSIGENAFPGSGLESITVAEDNIVYDSRENCNAIVETFTNTLICGCKNTTITNSITSIGKNAFFGCTGLTFIKIPNSVTSIGENAFRGCAGLTSIDIPESVTSIGDYAFYGCTGLVSLVVPNKVTNIGDYAFYGCTDLTIIEIPNSVKTIGNKAFAATGLTSVTINSNEVVSLKNTTLNMSAIFGSQVKEYTIGDSVTTIGKGAFSGCTGLASITIPNSVTSIDENAFSGCTGLTSIDIPESVTSIGNSVFESTPWYNNQPDGLVYIGLVAYKYKGTMPAGTTVKLKEGIKGIAGSAFRNNTGLSSIKIPNSVTIIGEYAFYGCTGLTLIEIPSSVINIGSSAFQECTSLKRVNRIIGDIAEWYIKEPITFGNKQSDPMYYAEELHIFNDDKSEITHLVITNGVTAVRSSAFRKCVGITSVFIGNSVTSIGGGAFYHCSGLQTIEFHSKFIGSWFDGNTNIKEIKIGDEVTSIGDNAFLEWRGLTSLTIPNSVTSIGDSAFFCCSGLTSIEIPNSVKTIGERAFGGCSSLTTIEIPNNITSISDYAFSDCGLTSIEIPNSVTSIGNEAFRGCTSLTSIEIPSSVTNIGSSAFRDCAGLISIEIPNGVTSIRDEAFYHCTGLTSVTMGNGVTSIGSDAFCYCRSLTAITIPSSVKTIGYCAFYKCSNLSSITIPEGVTVIEEEICNGCSSLTSISIPNGVTSIRKMAFQNCTNLTSIVIPNSVTSIGNYAFRGCAGLTSVVSRIITPFSIPSNVFSDISQKCVLSIPWGTKPAYTAEGWTSCFAEIIELSETYSLSVTSTGNGCATYNGTNVCNTTTSFPVTQGNSYIVTFTPDDGYKIKCVRLNGNDISSSVANNQYMISNFQGNVSLEVEFEHITYELTIKATGNGTIMYDETSVRGTGNTFTIIHGNNATISIIPDDGYRIKSVKQNGSDVTSSISNNLYTITNVKANTTIEVVFEAKPFYTISIISDGNGKTTYGSTTIKNQSKEFSEREGNTITISFTPDNGYRLSSVTVNGEDMLSQVVNYQLTIENISTDILIEVYFGESPITEFAKDNINYKVISSSDRTVNVVRGNYGVMLTVPSTCKDPYINSTWIVAGVEPDAFNNSPNLAAIIWNPEVQFNGNIKNPNLLLYVKDKKYAPTTVRNVVVDNVAEEITLSDAESGNPFYCPKAFTAQRIIYEHNYSMTSGYQKCQGWETLVLPFNVTTILRQNGTEIVPREAWVQGSNKLPFWLYTLTELGWRPETTIAANTPYIISMPNNENYNSKYNISGVIQFIGTNVEVKASDNMPVEKNGNKTFVPNYQYLPASESMYALNVNNQWCANTTTEAEGSVFIKNLRPVHPFEAYLTVNGSEAARRIIPIFEEGESTGIINLPLRDDINVDTWFTLDGRKLFSKPTEKGVYINKGKKVLVK